MSKFKQLVNKAVMKTKKNSPAILTGLGVIGLGATAYLAYKSRDKVEAVVLDIEEARENGEEINKVEVAKDIAEAIYLPVTVGTLSIGAIIWSYRIQNNRIAVLATTVAAQQIQAKIFEDKYRKEHGEEAYQRFMTPVEREETVEEGKNGKTKVTAKDVRQDIDKTFGQWYDESLEYVRDDHGYNMSMIDSITEKLELVLFQRGTLLLNEVREAFGFERIRQGALLGWTSGDIFNINKTVTFIKDEGEDEAKEQIYISWAKPRYIYDEIEFNGRYAVNS